MQREGYEIHRKIGEGTFSTVFLAEAKKSRRKLAVKKLTKTTSIARIVNELRLLKELKGSKNIIDIVTAERNEDEVSMVFPYVPADDFKEFLISRNLSDIKGYMFSLLTALQHIHSLRIIHRDIKPGNFLYEKEGKSGCLIDFGLSQKEDKLKEEAETETEEERKKKKRFFFSAHPNPKKEKLLPSRAPGYLLRDPRPPMTAPRSGTRGFRAPEVLFRVRNQTTAIDIWSAGVVLLTLLTKKYPFFQARDDIGAIVELASIFGDKEIRHAARTYRRLWKCNIDACIKDRVPFKEIVRQCVGDEQHPESLFELLNGMLELCPDRRITAEQALQHRFFTGD